IATAKYASVASEAELAAALEQIGLPALLKTRTEGYDGKGQTMIRKLADANAAWDGLGRRPAILEQVVNFSRELSVIAARGVNGETRFYPLSQNTHRDGILRLAVCRTADPMESLARRYVDQLLTALDYVGVVALELFEVNGTLLANEFAPRVHNSGHWTIEGAATSQFENHLRAITGLPLGATHAICETAMVNLIGAVPDSTAVLAIEECHLHLYGKVPRPGRKLGHITVRAADAEALHSKLSRLAGLPGVELER
ncbi:MAG: ATP-grasp domain-containing protein, partial [Gammaproteobacteria bacterium]|nr:ATP-grasp domain-containing protein [Gammaproteobacteria bacterium]